MVVGGDIYFLDHGDKVNTFITTDNVKFADSYIVYAHDGEEWVVPVHRIHSVRLTGSMEHDELEPIENQNQRDKKIASVE